MREESGGEKKRNNMKEERREARRNKHLKNVGVFFCRVCWPLFSTFLVLTFVSVVLSRLFTRRHPVCTDSISVESDATNADLATSFAETNAT